MPIVELQNLTDSKICYC